jgi:DNA topoisomerase-6 subunit A
MAIPKARFIGLSSANPDAYGLPRNVGIKLANKDFRYLTKAYLPRKLKEEDWLD